MKHSDLSLDPSIETKLTMSLSVIWFSLSLIVDLVRETLSSLKVFASQSVHWASKSKWENVWRSSVLKDSKSDPKTNVSQNVEITRCTWMEDANVWKDLTMLVENVLNALWEPSTILSLWHVILCVEPMLNLWMECASVILDIMWSTISASLVQREPSMNLTVKNV